MAKKKFYQTKVFDMIHVPDIVIKVKPYLYCTEKVKNGGIHHPKAEIKVMADVWVCVGTGKSQHGSWNRKTLDVDYLPRCEINIDEGTITRKGEQLTCTNVDMVIDVIRKRVFEAESEGP